MSDSSNQSNQTGTTRRTFIKTVGSGIGVGLIAGAAPAFVGAEDKAGTKNVILGQGEHTYECIHDWGMSSLPEGANYGNASHGVAVDEAGLIYITHQGKPGSLYVFDPDGKFVRKMADFHMLKGVAHGHGIDIRKEGNEEFIYVTASSGYLGWAKINLKGELVWRKDFKEIKAETGMYDGKHVRYRPTNVSFSPDGGYFLGDGYGSNYVHQYDKDDKYLRTIGGSGKKDGEFLTPHGQWLDARDGVPKLVVVDRANARLQWFDMEGKHLKTQGGFLFPADADVKGDVLVVPDLHCRITLLDKHNKVIVHLGDDPEWRKVALDEFKMRGQRPRWQPGKFIHPHDACFDREGNIFVTEWVATGRVTKLKKVS